MDNVKQTDFTYNHRSSLFRYSSLALLVDVSKEFRNFWLWRRRLGGEKPWIALDCTCFIQL